MSANLPKVQIVTCTECHEPVIKAEVEGGWINLEPREGLYAYDPASQSAESFNPRRQVNGKKVHVLAAHESRRCRAVLGARLDQKAKEQREVRVDSGVTQTVQITPEDKERLAKDYLGKPAERPEPEQQGVNVRMAGAGYDCKTCGHPEAMHFSGVCGVDGCTCPF